MRNFYCVHITKTNLNTNRVQQQMWYSPEEFFAFLGNRINEERQANIRRKKRDR